MISQVFRVIKELLSLTLGRNALVELIRCSFMFIKYRFLIKWLPTLLVKRKWICFTSLIFRRARSLTTHWEDACLLLIEHAVARLAQNSSRVHITGGLYLTDGALLNPNKYVSNTSPPPQL